MKTQLLYIGKPTEESKLTDKIEYPDRIQAYMHRSVAAKLIEHLALQLADTDLPAVTIDLMGTLADEPVTQSSDKGNKRTRINKD